MKKAWGLAPDLFARDPVSVLGFPSKDRELRGYDLRNWSNERDTWLLIGSVASAAILVESALISFAWLANTSNCRRMKADWSSTISARFLAPARLLARSKAEFRLRWERSMSLRLKAVAPWPAASKDRSSASIASSRAS